MKAVRVEEHGGPEVLRIVDLPLPEPGPGEVRVRVTHCALNHLDVWVRRGIEGHPFPLPLIPCADIVGIREDTGEAVEQINGRDLEALRLVRAGPFFTVDA